MKFLILPLITFICYLLFVIVDVLRYLGILLYTFRLPKNRYYFLGKQDDRACNTFDQSIFDEFLVSLFMTFFIILGTVSIVLFIRSIM